MSDLSAGLRLRCVACTTEVVVTMGDDGLLKCCGQPMMPAEGEGTDRLPLPDRADTMTLLGKRYRSPSSQLQVLCTRPGTGVLELDDTPLDVVRPKLLPASD